MGKALVVEVPCDRETFGRFYCRILRELGGLDAARLKDRNRPHTRTTGAGSLAAA